MCTYMHFFLVFVFLKYFQKKFTFELHQTTQRSLKSYEKSIKTRNVIFIA